MSRAAARQRSRLNGFDTMRSFLRLLVFLPLGLLILLFSMANREAVKISLDPFSEGDAELTFQTPMFLVVLVSMALGVLAGGLSSWLSHLPVRRDAKIARRDALKARSEMDELRSQALGSLDPGAQQPDRSLRR